MVDTHLPLGKAGPRHHVEGPVVNTAGDLHSRSNPTGHLAGGPRQPV